MGCVSHIPDHKLIVIAARCEHFVIVGTKAQPTHFLPVTIEILD